MKNSLNKLLLTTAICAASYGIYDYVFEKSNASQRNDSYEVRTSVKNQGNENYEAELELAINNEYRNYANTPFTFKFVENPSLRNSARLETDSITDGDLIDTSELVSLEELAKKQETTKRFRRGVVNDSWRVRDAKDEFKEVLLSDYLEKEKMSVEEFDDMIKDMTYEHGYVSYCATGYDASNGIPELAEGHYIITLFRDDKEGRERLISSGELERSATAEQEFSKGINDYVNKEYNESLNDPRALEVYVRTPESLTKELLRDYLPNHKLTWEEFFEDDKFYPRIVFKATPKEVSLSKPYFLIELTTESGKEKEGFDDGFAYTPIERYENAPK